MHIPAELWHAFPPSATSLIDVSRRDLDQDLVAWMVRSSHGPASQQLEPELLHVWETGGLPTPLGFAVAEVLERIRGFHPGRPSAASSEPGPTGRKGHQARLFACALLLKAAAEPAIEYVDLEPDSTLARALVSASVLGDEALEALASFLTWRLADSETEPYRLRGALALLILAVRLRETRFSDPSLAEIAGWVLDEELELSREQGSQFPAGEPEQGGLSLQQVCWQPIVDQFRHESSLIESEETRVKLDLCALMLDS